MVLCEWKSKTKFLFSWFMQLNFINFEENIHFIIIVIIFIFYSGCVCLDNVSANSIDWSIRAKTLMCHRNFLYLDNNLSNCKFCTLQIHYRFHNGHRQFQIGLLIYADLYQIILSTQQCQYLKLLCL